MTAVVFGLIAAVAWGTTSLAAARASRAIGAAPALAWVLVAGMALCLPFLAADAGASVSLETIGWLVVAGLGNTLGLLLGYAAIRRGPVGVAAPIGSTEGAIAALIAVVAGEVIVPGAFVAMAAILVGVVLATLGSGAEDPTRVVVTRRFVMMMIGVAVLLGIGLYAGGRVSNEAPGSWIVSSARVVGVAIIVVPLALRGGFRRPGVALPWIVATAIAEVIGFAAFVLGAQDSIAITAVLGAQFAAIAVVGARFLFHERMATRQWIGVVLICVGVTAV
ncbi:MAG: EamA family transporter, partial [Candidatus Limnocylindrales bacterium]